MTVELDNLNAAFDLTEDVNHEYTIVELQILLNAMLYVVEDVNEFELNRQGNLGSAIDYFRERMKDKNLAINEIVRESKNIEVGLGKAAARQYLMAEIEKSKSRFVRRILSDFVAAMDTPGEGRGQPS